MKQVLGQLVANDKVQKKINDHTKNQLVDLTRYNIKKHFTEASKEAIRLAQNRADDYVSDLENIVQSLNDGKVPVGLITKEVGDEIFSAFNKRAETLKCDPPLVSYHDIFSLDVQFVYSEEYQIIRVFLTAHMIPFDHKVPLYKYLPVPLVKSLLGNHTMTPVIREKNLIAYSNKDQYQEFSEVELGFCQLQGETYICKDRNILRTDVDASCLAGLFTQNTEIIGRECLMEFAKPTEQIYVIGENTWLVNIPEGRRIDVVCSPRKEDTRTHSSLFVKRMGIFQMLPGCETQLGRYHIRTDAFEDEVGEIRLSDWHCNPEDLFAPQELEDMVYLAHQLEDSNMVEFTTDDIKALEYTSEVNKKSNIRSMIVSVFVICVIVIIVVLVFIAYIKFRTIGHHIAARIRSYHRSHHSDRPDVNEKDDPLLYVPNFDKLYTSLMEEGLRKLGMSSAQWSGRTREMQGPKGLGLTLKTSSPINEQSACETVNQSEVQPNSVPQQQVNQMSSVQFQQSVANSKIGSSNQQQRQPEQTFSTKVQSAYVTASQPTVSSDIYPQQQLLQMYNEQFQPSSISNSNFKPGLNRQSMHGKHASRDGSYLAEKARSVGKPSYKSESSRKYGHYIHYRLSHLAANLECVRHDKTNGCLMAYYGPDEEVYNFVNTYQTAPWCED